jgi:hypothetical protein
MQAPICYLLHDYSIACCCQDYTFCPFAKNFIKGTALMESSLHVAMADWSTLQRDPSLETIDAEVRIALQSSISEPVKA